jgi:hypothetical protein
MLVSLARISCASILGGNHDVMEVLHTLGDLAQHSCYVNAFLVVLD